jgi:uncharacterized membrane protein YgcG
MAAHSDDGDDAWGPADAAAAAAARPGPRRGGGGAGGRDGAARRASAADAARLRPLLELKLSLAPPPPPAAAAAAARPAVLPLQALALGVVAAHVSELAGAPEACAWLPSELKASLLAAARRRGELTDGVLAALVDAGFTSLDVSGSRVSGAGLVAAAAAAPRLRALDAARCRGVSAGALVRVARRCPRLALLRLGGCEAADAAAAGALPRIAPAIAPAVAAAEDDGGRGGNAAAAALAARAGRSAAAAAAAEQAAAAAAREPEPAAAAESWEELAESEPEADEPGWDGRGGASRGGGGGGGGASSSGGSDAGGGAAARLPVPGAPGRLWELRVIVWPACPREAREKLQRMCPRVLLNPAAAAPRGAAALVGPLPPEVDPDAALDAVAFAAVGPAALQVGQAGEARRPRRALPLNTAPRARPSSNPSLRTRPPTPSDNLSLLSPPPALPGP